MSASADHLKALVRSHAAGDDAHFYAVALQVAARAARRGHNRLAADLKQLIDDARAGPVSTRVTPIARPRGELDELVTASFPEERLKDLVVAEPLAEQLLLVINEQRQRHRLLDEGFAPTNRLLLEGPPGTGKTMTARVIAHELALPLLTVRLDNLLSKFLGETASKLRVLFNAVAEHRAVYLFDEFDALGGDRAGNDVGEARRILNSFLVFLEEDGLSQSVVIAATNHQRILDHALFRRFDIVLRYDLPDADQAIAVMKARLGAVGKGLQWPSVRPTLPSLSHAELVKAVESAAKRALLRGDPTVSAQDLIAALGERERIGRRTEQQQSTSTPHNSRASD